MAIRLSHSCSHCKELNSGNICGVHDVKVNSEYTCDSFTIRTSLKTSRDCTNCARFNGETCAHPKTAAEGMLCSSWAPQA